MTTIAGALSRPTDQIIDIADAVVSVLNAATLTPAATSIARGYNIHYKLENVTEDAVYVDVAMASDAEEQGSRGCAGADTIIQVGVRSLLSDTTNATIDPLVELAGQIRNLFRGGQFSTELGSTYCSAATNLSIYNPQHIAEWTQFTSIIELTFITR